MEDMHTTAYDGCGRCLIGLRRLSRKTDTTHSPERQGLLTLDAARAVEGHIIAWADDWEISGATNPRTRPQLGPWLRGEMGQYDGLAGAAIDRIGRNVRDVLNTAYENFESGRILVTACHTGVWNLNDPNDEAELLIKAMGAQLEHRSMRTRNREETTRARKAGQVKQMNSYGYKFVHKPRGGIEEIVIDMDALAVLLDVSERILFDTTGRITANSEAARLNRAGQLSPADHRRVLNGKEPVGGIWTGKTLRGILVSEAALGYLMHDGYPVIGDDGHPVRIAPPLWSPARREAHIAAVGPKRSITQSAKSKYMLSHVGECGNCATRLYVTGRNGEPQYHCKGKVLGIPESQDCKPAPCMPTQKLDEIVQERFLARYGSGEVLQRVYDPGTGYASRIAELKADRLRLRNAHAAGLYREPDDEEWFRDRYTRMGDELAELSKLPERPAEFRTVPTGTTIADQWFAAPDALARREILQSFGVKVRLHPRWAGGERVTMTGNDLYSIAC